MSKFDSVFRPLLAARRLRRLQRSSRPPRLLPGNCRPCAAEEAVVIPPPSIDEKPSAATEKAVFAGGCFWGVQGVFQHVKGVTNAVSGYSGGDKDTAHYEMVGSGQTGHAEAVEVTYDPSKVTYGQLLQVYFSVAHNPTQLNYQGPDHGTQYRSTIFVANDEQKKIAAELHRRARQGEAVFRRRSSPRWSRSRPSTRPRTIIRIS